MRITKTFSVGLLVAGLAAASVVGCGGAPDAASTQPSTATAQAEVEATPAPSVAAEPVAEKEAEAGEAPAARARRHGPFAHLDAMDLRPEQRAKIDAIHDTLTASLEPGRREGRELALLLAAGIDGGHVDEAAVKAKRVALETRIQEARKAFGDAANAVHATLDADQRTELVLTLRAKREGMRAPKEAAQGAEHEHAHHGRGIGRLATELGLSAEQTKSIREGARSIVEAALPDRKERRENMEAEVKAAEEAFMSDTFDAHRYSFGKDATAWLDTAAKGATKLSDLAASVLTQGQRAALAQKIREGAVTR